MFDGALFHHYMRLHAESTKEPIDEGAYNRVTAGLAVVSEANTPAAKSAAAATKPVMTVSALKAIVPSAVIKRGPPPSSTSTAATTTAAVDTGDKKKKQTKGTAPPPTAATAAATNELPIDKYRTEILQKIARDRVVIIHGETG